MIPQAEDYREEARVLAALLEDLDPSGFETVTQFKGWTIEDVLGHLHMFDVAALRALESDDAFFEFYAPLLKGMSEGKSLLDLQRPWLAGLGGRNLFEAWRKKSGEMADAFAMTDPKKRLKWAGPDMSALSSITARQMETWAHGQEIFDILGVARQEGDRIKNICHLGVSTFGWTFVNRKWEVPDPAPFVVLTAPSGATWEWNTPQPDNRIEGDAVEFAQVVTQVRNVADTGLSAIGDTAMTWMANAQCFAGPPHPPPAKGSRYRVAIT